MKLVLIRIFHFIDRLVYLICRSVFPLEKNLIIFEAAQGEMNDSSLELFNNLREANKYRFVWMVKHPSSYSSIERTTFVNRFRHSLNIRADYFYARAAFSFYTHTTSSIKYKRKGQTIIFIGHGFAFKGNKGHGKKYHNFDFALSIGEPANQTQANFIGCSPNKMLPLGLPRNDLLLKSKNDGSSNPWNKGFRKVIVWMPTFRESKIKHLTESHCATETGLPLINDGKKLDELNEILSEHNACILLKPHPLQAQKPIFFEQRSNIIIVKDEDIDSKGLKLYEMIAQTDALLTDYSSVAVDYLLLDKPIGFILSDMEEYKQDRGFVIDDPTTLMPGHHIYTTQKLYDFIEDLSNDHDEFHKARHKIKLYLHAAHMGNSCDLIKNYFHL